MSRKIQFNAPITIVFALASLAALFASEFTGGRSNMLLFSVYRSSLNDPLTYVRAFTHVLGHAGFEHYFSNFMMILLLGPIAEEKYGSTRLLAMMTITALVTGTLNMLLFPRVMLLGASGVAFMLIILCSFANLQGEGIPITFILVVVIYLGREVLLTITVQDNISRLTHIAGGICGGGIGYFLNRSTFRQE